jgi:short-subunit dehydrogenase
MSLPRPASDRTALVTGASSGIGKELARELARHGHLVTLVARSEEKLEKLAAEIEGAGGRAHVLAADLSDRKSRAVLPELLAEFGVVPNILVNNAGLSTSGAVAAADPDAELTMVEVDVTAVADLCTRFLGPMVRRGRGAVLNVASTGAFQPLPGQAGYGACKAFVLSYTRSLAGELRGTEVTATALCPGPVATGFGEGAGLSQGDAEKALPSILWKDAAHVAKVGVDGMAAGRMVAIPGLANRVGALLANLTPKRLLVSLIAAQHPSLRPQR